MGKRISCYPLHGSSPESGFDLRGPTAQGLHKGHPPISVLLVLILPSGFSNPQRNSACSQTLLTFAILFYAAKTDPC